MMTANKEPFYWRTNEEWYEYDKETDSLKVLDTAPERAKKVLNCGKIFQKLKKKK